MKEQILKYTIYVVGAICAFVFAVAHMEEAPFWLVDQEMLNYTNMNNIDHFQEKLPPRMVKYRFSDKHPDLNDADILTFGDSFFDFNHYVSFPERLGDELGQSVFYARNDFPLNYLSLNDYQKPEQERIIIYECVERNIAKKFAKPHTHEATGALARSKAKEIADVFFPPKKERNYNFMLERTWITSKIHSQLSTARFDWLGYVPQNTPKYKLDPPWLFYYKTVNEKKGSFYYDYSFLELETVADNIRALAATLKSEYNLQLVFMPIPNKYTVYHSVINADPYNEFLPKLQERLEERGIPIIDVYHPYLNADHVLYHPTETHWNEKGIDLAVSVTASRLKGLE